MTLVPRNEALVFAKRTRKNLLFLEKASQAGDDVHVVTQLIAAMLGLLVFPKEKDLTDQYFGLRLRHLEEDGWPKWRYLKNDSTHLGNLIKHVRNAVAHGRISFSSDSKKASEVTITVYDCKKKGADPYWIASINGEDLKSFCFKLIELIEHNLT